MTENPTESARDTQEPTATPKPVVPSVDTGAQQTSEGGRVDASDLAKQVENLTQQFEELRGSLPDLAERAIQSTKDRRLRPLADLGEEGIEALRSFKRYLDKYGDEEEAIRQMRIDSRLDGSAVPNQAVGAAGMGLEGRMERVARRFLANAGLSISDPRYEEWANAYGFSDEERFYDDLEVQIDTWRTQTAKQTQAVGEGTVVPAPASYALSEDAEELAAQLARLQAPQPGEPGITHPDNIAQRKAILEKLKTVTPQRPDIK